MNRELYETYKRLRTPWGGWSSQARLCHRMARDEIVREVGDILLGNTFTHLDVFLDESMPLTRYKGYDIDVRLVPDDDAFMCDDMRGFTTKAKVASVESHVGWGQDGMDWGEYVGDEVILQFETTRGDLLRYMAKGMSKQVAYEAATERMRSMAATALKILSQELMFVGVVVECDELDLQESLWGIEYFDATGDYDHMAYIREVVRDLYSELRTEIDSAVEAA